MGWYTSATFLAALLPLIVFIVDTVWRSLRHRIERKGLPLPPGPIPLPLVGSALSINSQTPWLTYTEWRAKYGDIIYIRLLDTDVVVLNSPSVATKLLEQRSRIYSDRPFISTIVPYGQGFSFGFHPYGDRWRFRRRIFQQTFRAHATPIFQPVQLRGARQLIFHMIDHPDEYHFHFQTFAGSVSMSAVYDYEPIPRNDPMISIVDNFLRASLLGLAPGKILLLKFFPFLLHIPVWLPGSWISREAQEAYALGIKVVDTPYKYAQQHMESRERTGTAMVPDHIARMEKFTDSHRSEYETALKSASATAFSAAAETTSSLLTTFALAMVENPEVWRRAQMEIDAVVGTDRLPEFDDRHSLPYVEAILRETMRWRPVLPLTVPHAVTRSDIYEGYYIPKGTTVFVNAWAMSRDETRYPNAEKFMPERFLDEKGRLTDDDPRQFIFGFGRRICPGRYFADASLWSAIVTMLSTLDFNLAKDADGNDIAFKATFTGGFTDHPNPFPCRITPRAHISKEAIGRILGT